jgi:hypothetical protein
MRTKYSRVLCSASALTLWAATSIAAPAADASLSDGAAPLVDAGPMDLVWFAEQWAAAKCDSLQACCATGGLSFDILSCKHFAMVGLGDFFSSGTHGYDPRGAAPCFAALRSYFALCPEAGAGGICSHVYIGRVPLGGACADPSECAPVSGHLAWCNTDLLCVDAPRGRVGDACFGDCSALNHSCQGNGTNPFGCYDDDGLTCSTVSGTCEKTWGRVGETCISGQCVTDAHCDTGVCRSAGAIGAACSDDSWCDPAERAFCDQTTGQCARFKAPLESCGPSDRCIVGDQCVQGRCPHAPAGQGRVCGIAPVDGGIVGVDDAAATPLDASSPRRDAASPRDASQAPRADAQASGSEVPDSGAGGGSRDTAYIGRSNGGCSCRISRPTATPIHFGLLFLGLLVARRPLSLWRRRPLLWRRRRSRSTGC